MWLPTIMEYLPLIGFGVMVLIVVTFLVYRLYRISRDDQRRSDQKRREAKDQGLL